MALAIWCERLKCEIRDWTGDDLADTWGIFVILEAPFKWASWGFHLFLWGTPCKHKQLPPPTSNYSNNNDKYPLNNSPYNSLRFSRETRRNMKMTKSLFPFEHRLENLCRGKCQANKQHCSLWREERRNTHGKWLLHMYVGSGEVFYPIDMTSASFLFSFSHQCSGSPSWLHIRVTEEFKKQQW